MIYPKSPKVAMWLRINLIQTQQTRNYNNTTNQEQESLNNKTSAFFLFAFFYKQYCMFHVWFQYCHNKFYFHNEFYCFLRDFYRVINLYKCKMQNEGDYKYPGDYKYAGWLQINHYITVVLITLRYEINIYNSPDLRKLRINFHE